MSILGRVNRRSLERDRQLAASIVRILQKQDLDNQIASIQAQKDILLQVYESATAYSNLIIIAGYAGAFAVWQFVKSDLNPSAMMWAGTLLLISTVTFISFELYKMISHALVFRRIGTLLQNAGLEEDKRIGAWHMIWAEYGVREARVWMYFLLPTVACGFLGGGILLWSLIRSL